MGEAVGTVYRRAGQSVCRELFRLYPTPEHLPPRRRQMWKPSSALRTVSEPRRRYPCDLRHSRRRLGRDWCRRTWIPFSPCPAWGARLPISSAATCSQPGIVADCIRICGRLGFTPRLKDPVRAERILSPLIPPEAVGSATASCSLDGIPAPPAPPACGACPLRSFLCARAKASLMGTRNRRTNRRFLKNI